MRTAVELDGTLAEVRYTLAASAFYYRWDWDEAEKEFRRALSLNPNLVEARFEYAWFLSTMGRLTEAIAEARRAVERDPLSVSANLALGSIYGLAYQYDLATAQLNKTLELDPSDPRPYEFLAGLYHRMGNHAEAVRMTQKRMLLSGARREEVTEMERVFRDSGYPGWLAWRLSRIKDTYAIARTHAQLGHTDEALSWLEKAYREHHWAMVRIRTHHEWDSVRSDPRFQDLLCRMNFPP